MKKSMLSVLTSLFLVAAQAFAQQLNVTGKVTSEQGAPLFGVTVTLKGTTTRAVTNDNGNFTIHAEPGQTLQFRVLGKAPQERVIGADGVVNVALSTVATSLDAVVVTALGQSTAQRALGTAQQTVRGQDVADAQRENFVNSLQGRIAGVDVVSTSGVPGASSSIVIRGISSISSSNQPLMILDGLPMDNRTMNTGVLASDNSSTSAFSNRSVDFTNRASDLNPEDIESITVLKGPEAAALYGIDAANGAIVITTKRGKQGGGFQYSNSFRFEKTRAKPELQRIWGPSGILVSPFAATNSFAYFGAPYAPGTKFYDNIDGFLRTGKTATNNFAFSGATADDKINYRLATSFDKQEGVVPTADYQRVNVTGASQAQITSWLNTDLSMAYTYATNDQVYKGEIGPLMGLMTWPQTDDATNYLTPAGTRRKLTTLSAGTEVDNPYFNIYKNQINSKNNRIIANVGILLTPVSWANLKSNIGTDAYTNSNLLLRNPESVVGFNYNGLLDLADLIQKNTNIQTLLNFNSRQLTNSLSISGLLGNSISDYKATTDAATGRDFLDPNFVSINNTNTRTSKTTIEQRRLVGAFAQMTLNFRDYLFFNATGRNDWTSTIPKGRNSFFYPSFSTSFIFSDAFPSVRRFMTGKLRAAVASVGKDARPYAYRPALEYKTTAYGGYGYGFWGPNLDLKPEFARSREFGVELSFLQDRLGLDATFYRKQTLDQIVNDIRGSYGTGFILFNLNGAATRNKGVELTLRGTPIQRSGFSWDFQANYAKARGIVVSLPHSLPESYVSDTWLYGNIRNGTQPGLSTMSLTGLFYLRDTVKGSPAYGQLLIDPTSGLPIRSSSFVDGGYDRQPKYTIGLSNTFRRNRLSLDFLVDIRRGGDVFNATEHYLTARGLSTETLDRDQPRVIAGVLRDGKEGTANPTYNNIVVIPSVQTDYYRLISEELFIEKNINWVRLRDVQLSYGLPSGFWGTRSASVFVKGTDLALWTNYKGLDPIVNGNSAAVGGSGGAGIDFGNFPIPRGVNFGMRLGF
ncbi:MAG TPA: SusC/RagA family TonB-linked outer membrane protein [Gemmatimonadaceae bacterium]|nr:SusC/RagA family TonB-linked outer membrane protein [Gemmatimonadaceae bacterium]